MKLAVLLLSCSGSARITEYDQAWVHRVIRHLAGYYLEQSGGREQMEFRVLDWFQLPQTSQQWNELGFGAGPVVKPLVEAGLQVDLSAYDYFALVIDKFDAALAAVSPTHPHYLHVGAQSLDPALLAHECGHFFGAGNANLDTPNGPAEYDNNFCVMGREGAKYSFVHTPLNRTRPYGTIDTSLSDTGPGMAAPAVASWGRDNIDIVALGLDQGGWHKAWAQGQHSSPVWEFLGGPFTSPPAVCSWRPAQLDIIALGLDQGVWHEAWAQDWWPSVDGWEQLDGIFSSAPSVVSWAPDRLDIFAAGTEASHLQYDAVCQ